MAGPYSQIGRQLGGSIGSFFDPRARQAGELAGLQQAGLEQQLQLGALKMDAARQEAADKAQEAAMRTPEATVNRVSAAFGVPLDNVGDVATALQTGRIDRFNTGGMAGPTMPTPDWAAPKNLGRIAQMFAAEQAVQGGAAKNVREFFDALGSQASSALASQIADGTMSPQVGGARSAAIAGKPLFDFREFGAGDLFGGKLDATQAAPLYVAGKQAEIGARNAAANASNAAALNSKANADKTNAERESGTKTGNVQIVTGQDGSIVLVDKGTGKARPAVGQDGKPVLAAKGSGKLTENEQRIQDATDVLGLLDLAGPLIDASTNSIAGNAFDQGARAIGVSTDGAQAAAQLRALEGALISKMPKMSGPQSDKDVLLYKQMAGQIGDPTIPAGTKKAAMDTIRAINQRQAGGKGARTVVRTGMQNGRKVVQYSDGTLEYAN